MRSPFRRVAALLYCGTLLVSTSGCIGRADPEDEIYLPSVGAGTTFRYAVEGTSWAPVNAFVTSTASGSGHFSFAAGDVLEVRITGPENHRTILGEDRPTWIASYRLIPGDATKGPQALLTERIDTVTNRLVSVIFERFQGDAALLHWELYGFPALMGSSVFQGVNIGESKVALEVVRMNLTSNSRTPMVFSGDPALMGHFTFSSKSVEFRGEDARILQLTEGVQDWKFRPAKLAYTFVPSLPLPVEIEHELPGSGDRFHAVMTPDVPSTNHDVEPTPSPLGPLPLNFVDQSWDYAYPPEESTNYLPLTARAAIDFALTGGYPALFTKWLTDPSPFQTCHAEYIYRRDGASMLHEWNLVMVFEDGDKFAFSIAQNGDRNNVTVLPRLKDSSVGWLQDEKARCKAWDRDELPLRHVTLDSAHAVADSWVGDMDVFRALLYNILPLVDLGDISLGQLILFWADASWFESGAGGSNEVIMSYLNVQATHGALLSYLGPSDGLRAY